MLFFFLSPLLYAKHLLPSANSRWEVVTLGHLCHSHGRHSKSVATLYSLFTESHNPDLSFPSAYMLRVLIKMEKTLQSLFWSFDRRKLWRKWVRGWPNIGHYIKWTSPVDIPGWIAVRRYFLQADRRLRVSDVEGFNGPDRLLHSACMLRRYGLQSSCPFPCSQWNRLIASVDHTTNLLSSFRPSRVSKSSLVAQLFWFYHSAPTVSRSL